MRSDLLIQQDGSTTGRRRRPFAWLCVAVGLPALALLVTVLMLRPGPAPVPRAGDVGGAASGGRSPGLSAPGGEEQNGEFLVELFTAEGWQVVGSLGYRQFLAKRSLDLNPPAGEVRIRLTYAGGRAAQVDSAHLGDRLPVGVDGAGEELALALKKLADRDHDLLDARDRSLVLTYEPVAGPVSFSLVARIEPERLSKTPFQFPLENTYHEMNEESAFYTYAWDSRRGALVVDGDLSGEDLGEPFFQAFTEPGSGHPDAFTYGWVWNDDETLYVVIEFASDNTVDGDADYAKVYVNGPDGLRGFRVSVPEQAWGVPGFVYTPRVVYQHKVYEFAIPLAETGLTGLSTGQPVELAFAAYGTAAPPDPPLFPGRLDPSFGVGGRVTTTFPGGELIPDVALQPDGKIVVAGNIYDGADDDFILARYLPTGALDLAFGTGGVVTTAISGGNDRAHSLVLQPDGRIVVGGYAGSGSGADFALARYLVTGTLDAGFGSGGVVTTPVGSGADSVQAISRQPDGKIVAVGYAEAGSTTDFALARYLVTGTLDTSFGVGGIVTTAISSGNDRGRDVVLQPDGKIVVGGVALDGRPNTVFALARYLVTGTLDTGFGTGGAVTTSIGAGRCAAYGVALQSSGRIVLGGWTDGGSTNDDFALARYLVTGTLDTSFGSTGVVTTEFGNTSGDVIHDIAVLPDDRILTAGTATSYLALARYGPHGSLDPTFGVSGVGKVNTPFSGSAVAHAVAVQPDGKTVAVGYFQEIPFPSGFALARYGLDLAVVKHVTPTTVRGGEPVTYTLRFFNRGAPAVGVKVVDDVPLGIDVTGVISSGVPMTLIGAGPVYTWTVGMLGWGQTGMITLTGVLTGFPEGEPVVNTARIYPQPIDCFPGNNSDSAVLEPFRIYLPLIMRNS